MSENYAISRIESYKFSDCGGVYKEALRILPNYDNPNCNPDKSHLNVALVDSDIKNIEKYILKYRDDNDIKGRFNTVGKNPKTLTNVMCQALFTMSNDYINALSRDEQIQYFNDCLEFFKEEFPSAHIVAANIHYDETTPHLHITFLPIVERVNKKTNKQENIFSTTLLMPGKDFFPQYQDRFYKYISSKYDGLTRSRSMRKNLLPKEYRKVAPIIDTYEKENKELRHKLFLANKILNNPLIKNLVNYIKSGTLEALNNIISELCKERDRLQRTSEKGNLDDFIKVADERKTNNIKSRLVKSTKKLFQIE